MALTVNGHRAGQNPKEGKIHSVANVCRSGDCLGEVFGLQQGPADQASVIATSCSGI